tara:strand:+ start:28 stop:741 length:714 start_codon:yes stop_codon:yes gene_type:complete
MKNIDLLEYFIKTGYVWKKDENALKEICKFTKTRVKPNIAEFEFNFGSEQTFLIKAIAEHIKAKNFFEIGTGRGTACYAVSLIPEIENITTIDIRPHGEKMSTAINYEPAHVSMSEIHDMIPFPEKQKINFHHRVDVKKLKNKYENFFDLCFIDGNHDDETIIKEDLEICLTISKKNATIIFDDYHLNQFKVRDVVDEILNKSNNFDASFIKFHGHLFHTEKRVSHYGFAVLQRNNK